LVTGGIYHALRECRLTQRQQQTLQQLPFIGKHSVPPKIRHDLWTPHCRVGPFPTAKQGQDALKKLQELRRLNLYNWNKTNAKLVEEMKEEDWADVQTPRNAGIAKKPLLVMNWHKPGFLQKRKLIRLLMDYRANATADLARVLSIQQQMGKEVYDKYRERVKERNRSIRSGWTELRSLTQEVDAGQVKELDAHIANLSMQRTAALEQSQKEQVKIIDKEIATLRKEIEKMHWASRMVQELDKRQADIDADFEGRMTRYNEHRLKLGKHTAPTPTAETAQPAAAQDTPTTSDRTPKKRENTFAARIHPTLPRSSPTGFSLRNIECHWADLYDAEHATKHWPPQIVHDTLQLTVQKRRGFVTQEEIEAEARRKLAEQLAEEQKLERAQLLAQARADASEVQKVVARVTSVLPVRLRNRVVAPAFRM
jgi:hypothetical protein